MRLRIPDWNRQCCILHSDPHQETASWLCDVCSSVDLHSISWAHRQCSLHSHQLYRYLDSDCADMLFQALPSSVIGSWSTITDSMSRFLWSQYSEIWNSMQSTYQWCFQELQGKVSMCPLLHALSLPPCKCNLNQKISIYTPPLIP